MSIDMSQFHDAFFEECHEHLNEIEHLLMSVDVSAPDMEVLNSIFRSAHSIKGGSGIFGFDALISVTHVMENLFDKARKQEYQLTTAVVDSLLRTVDALRQLLSSYQHGHDPDWELVAEQTKVMEGLLTNVDIVHDETEQGFGFFLEPEKSSGTDEGFGFFEPLADLNAKLEAFGFFEPEPEVMEKSEQPVISGLVDVVQSQTAEKMEDPAPVSTISPVSGNTIASAQKKAQVKTEAIESSSIRVDTVKVDALVNQVGELVITQSMLAMIGERVEGEVAELLQSALRELERNTLQLQESIMSIRMLPMSFAFNRFPRVVRDLSTRLGKEVELVIEGGHTEIDKGLIEKLVDPLTHLIRNSIDHGIEMPAVRLQKGKAAQGHVFLTAEQRGGAIVISIKDDGAGLNRERIISKAQQSGINLPDNPTDEQVWQLIFAPGFSTAAAVTDVSGRGVGMDVVKRNISSLGGRIELASEQDRGTKLTIYLPLTLAILDGMVIRCGDQRYVLPLTNIVESVQPQPEQIKTLANEQLLSLRDIYWPVLPLGVAMSAQDKVLPVHEQLLVLVETSNNKFALQVDEVIGQQQVVIKSLEQNYKKVPGVAGATIMGDGSVALILDAESLGLRFNSNKQSQL